MANNIDLETSEDEDSRLTGSFNLENSGPEDSSTNRSISSKPYACIVSGCSARFSRPWRLKAHNNVHLGRKPFPCDYDDCDKAYTSNYHLRRHKLTAHTNRTKNSFRCNYDGCEKEFTLIQNMKKHFRRTHIEKTCETCGEQFYNRLQLKKHMWTHSGGFKCRECNIRFDYRVHFNRHKRGHKLHACPVRGCVQVYTNWTLLRKHLVTHPFDYVCMYCKKGYRRKKFLRAHILRHMVNEGQQRKKYVLKKYSCDICQAELLGKGSLQRHIKNIHMTSKKAKQKPKKSRAPRKDKGVPKRALAVILSEVAVPKEFEKELLESSRLIEPY